MDYILQEERMAHDSFDAFNHLQPQQERALYQCFDAETENTKNVILGDYNSGKRLVMTWLVRLKGGSTLIAVSSRIEMLKWKHHFGKWDGSVHYLPLWNKKLCAKRVQRLEMVWFDRFILDVGATEPFGKRFMFNHLWSLNRRGDTKDAGLVMLTSPFSLSLFRVFEFLSRMVDWKMCARFEESPPRLYTLLSFIRFGAESHESSECPVCCETSDAMIVTSCHHAFCSVCLFSSFLYTTFKCPLCRHDLEMETFSWRGPKRLAAAVIDDFSSFSLADEFAAVYDPQNQFPSIPRARLGEQAKVCRLVRSKSYSVPLAHITHLFSTVKIERISSTFLKKYFSSFDRKKHLKIFYIGN
jgi:hypothetical protein